MGAVASISLNMFTLQVIVNPNLSMSMPANPLLVFCTCDPNVLDC